MILIKSWLPPSPAESVLFKDPPPVMIRVSKWPLAKAAPLPTLSEAEGSWFDTGETGAALSSQGETGI